MNTKIKNLKNRNLKFFWIKKLAEWIHDNNCADRLTTDKLKWKETLWEKDTIKDIEEYAIKLWNKTWGGSSFYTVDLSLSNLERPKYLEAKNEDSKEGQMLKKLEDDLNDCQNQLNNYQTDLKNIIGNDLTNWKSKIVKAGHNDKDLADLQQKVSDLTQEKSSLTKQKQQLDKKVKEKEGEVATKQAQINNHRCENPNQQELNQVKEELTKITAERDTLKTQLEQKGPDLPLPEEKENNDNLTLEELKTKLNHRWQEVQNLKEQLKKKEQQLKIISKPNSTPPPPPPYLSLSIVLFGVSALLFGSSLINFWRRKRKIKKGK